MNIITNEGLIKRNRRIAQTCSIGGLIILIGGMILSFRNQQQIGYSLGALIIGFILSQIGIYFTNRWGRSPRPDEYINQALKGLDSKYSLFHYQTPASHLLVGPAGVWVILPRQQQGVITYSKGRYHQKGGNLYLKLFAQEGLGRPELELGYEVEKIQNYLRKHMEENKIPPIQAALVFTNDRADIKIDESDNPPAVTLHINKLKEYLRKYSKNKPVSIEKISEIQNLLLASGNLPENSKTTP
jgi:hypothetical protein